MFGFGKKKKPLSFENHIEAIAYSMEDGSFRKTDGRLYWKNGEKLICYDLSEDDNGQYTLHPSTAASYQSPWLLAGGVSEEEAQEYETRTLMWLASLGKFALLD